MPNNDPCYDVCHALALAGEFTKTQSSQVMFLLRKIVSRDNYEKIKSEMGGSYIDVFEADYEGFKKKTEKYFESTKLDYQGHESLSISGRSPEFVRAISECLAKCGHSSRAVDLLHVAETEAGLRFSFIWRPTLPPQEEVTATGFVDGGKLLGDTSLFSGEPVTLQKEGDYISFLVERAGTSDVVIGITVNDRADLSITARIPYVHPPALRVVKYRVELTAGENENADGPIGNMYLHLLGDMLHLPFEPGKRIGRRAHLEIEMPAGSGHFYEDLIGSRASLIRQGPTTNGIQIRRMSLAARIEGQSGWRVFKELAPGWMDRKAPKRSARSNSGDYNLFRFLIRE